MAVRIASCANRQPSRPRLLRFRSWGRRFSRPGFLERGGFTRHSQLGYRYLPTYPWTSPLLAFIAEPKYLSVRRVGKGKEGGTFPPLLHHCPGSRHQMQHNFCRLETFFRHQVGAVQDLLGKAISIPFIHPPGNIPLFRCQILEDFPREPAFRPSRTPHEHGLLKNMYCGLRFFPFYTSLEEEEDSDLVEWVDEGACPRAPGEAQ